MEEIRQTAAAYRERFGQPLVIRAAGKTSHQILRIMRDRVENDGPRALRSNAEETLQITHSRLKRLLPRL